MTIDEAISIMNVIVHMLEPQYDTDRIEDAVEMAIKALEQEPCSDCISREATVERLCKIAEIMNKKREGLGSPYVMAALFIQDNKDEFPPVTPQPKMGRWINAKVGKMFPSNDYKCSECGNILDFDGVNCGRGDANYCPNCGAKMQEVEE